MSAGDKPLLRALRGEVCIPPPVWVMRQAGRYLPEYRKTRALAHDFLEFCLTPELAVEATLQPIRRYGLDGAILFSDILVIPYALGQRVWFDEGSGPRLEPILDSRGVSGLRLECLHERLESVYETLRRVGPAVPETTALIGFAGAPWTVASYMVEGGTSRNFAEAKKWAYGRREEFASLIDLLIEATTEYLIAQAKAGAEVLQLFDSWAGVWPEAAFRRWCLGPVTEIRERVHAVCPGVPLILFPRGAGVLYAACAAESRAEGLGLDPTVPLGWAREVLQPQVTLQGNLDPMLLLIGGKPLRVATSEILAALGHGPFIFNLGHGVLPETSPEHLADLVAQVRAWHG